MSDRFDTTLGWAKREGLYLNDNLERKSDKGIFGIYAKEDIKDNLILASFPLESLIKIEDDYPSNTSISAKQIHSAAKAYDNKENSKYSNFFNFFDSIEYLKKFSTFFINEKEKQIINEASPFLLKQITTQNHLNTFLIEALYQFDPSISKETYTFITLNYNSRAIGSSGFVPIVECFNHSNEKGEFIHTENNKVVLKSKVSYKKGEQVFISYGALDIFSHAINYNYFAPDEDHYLLFHKRFFFPLLTNNDNQIARELSRLYSVAAQKMDGLNVFSVQDKDAYLNQEKPSQTTMKIVEKLAQKKDKNEYLLIHLKQMLSSNNVSQFSEKYFPARVKRFYWVLLKEKEILLKNIEYISNELGKK